ncbi:MotA/TolQ/ExbB proton channel family protein [bacterium]|nr:MotA/TolQ/ExbB proton channel family protein [bacterium]
MFEDLNVSLLDQLGVLGYPLLICSCLILSIIIERLVFFLLTYPVSKQLVNQIVQNSRLTVSNDLKVRLLHNPFGKILLELIENRDRPFDERERFCSIKLVDVEKPLTRFLPVLKILASISPLLGLLGTVLGMINSFKLISSSNQPITPSLVSGGISQALLTTAIGLVLALLALVTFSLFQMRVKTLMQHFIQQLNIVNLHIQQCTRLSLQERRGREIVSQCGEDL